MERVLNPESMREALAWAVWVERTSRDVTAVAARLDKTRPN
jgi:hypothetical protein